MLGRESVGQPAAGPSGRSLRTLPSAAGCSFRGCRVRQILMRLDAVTLADGIADLRASQQSSSSLACQGSRHRMRTRRSSRNRTDYVLRGLAFNVRPARSRQPHRTKAARLGAGSVRAGLFGQSDCDTYRHWRWGQSKQTCLRSKRRATTASLERFHEGCA